MVKSENLWQGGNRMSVMARIAITFCILGNFSYLCCRLLTFFKMSFLKILSGTLLKYQMVWIQIRTNILGHNLLQRPSADGKSLLARKRVFFQNYLGNIIRESNGLDPDQDRHSGSKLFAKAISRRQVTASKEKSLFPKLFREHY